MSYYNSRKKKPLKDKKFFSLEYTETATPEEASFLAGLFSFRNESDRVNGVTFHLLFHTHLNYEYSAR